MGFSKRHYRLVSPVADTKADIASRLRDNAALARARADVEARYPKGSLTAENIGAALDYQQERIRFHRAAEVTA